MYSTCFINELGVAVARTFELVAMKSLSIYGCQYSSVALMEDMEKLFVWESLVPYHLSKTSL